MKTYKFYLRGGQIVIAVGINKLKMLHNTETGRFTGYEINWEPGYQPAFFSIVPDDIAAVVSEP